MLNRKISGSIIIFCLFILTSCTNLKYDVIPDSKSIYNSVKAKILFKSNDFKFSGKILLKYNKFRDKILFLSPLNQIYFKLFVSEENTLLINSKKKKFWSGNFNILFERMGNINFGYDELKQLILEGIVPENKVKENALKLTFEKNKKSGKPKRIKITGRDILIKLKILSTKERKGKINFLADLKNFKRTDLNDALTNE